MLRLPALWPPLVNANVTSLSLSLQAWLPEQGLAGIRLQLRQHADPSARGRSGKGCRVPQPGAMLNPAAAPCVAP